MAFVNFTNLTDWQYDTATKQIKHNTGTVRITVNALYSEVMDEFDNSGQMDDTVPMSAQTPTEYSLINGWTFSADSDVGYLYGGSIVVQKATSDRDVWANFYTLGTIDTSGVVYWYQNATLVAAYPGYTAGHADILIKVVSAGTDVGTDGSALAVRAYLRHDVSGTSDLYDHFTSVASATGGRNPVPLATSTDTNDDYTVGSAVTGVTITFGTTSQDIGDGNGAQNYDVLINGGANSVANVYKYLKYWTRRGNTSAVGTGNALQAQFYRAANTAYNEVKQAPFGSFAGGKIYGARGIYITNVSDPSNRVLIDAAGTTRQPPTLITASITGVSVGDRVFMARSTGAGLTTVNKTQFTLNGAHSSGAATIVVNEVVGLDIPTAGTIRVLEASYSYTALNRATKTFTISGTLGVAYSTGAGAYVPLIDITVPSGTSVASPAIQYVSDINVVYRVRKKGIQPFENTGTVSSANFAAAAIRTADTIAT